MEGKTCCFIGHRTIINESIIRQKINETVQMLIKIGVSTFYFGSKSAFDNIALEIVSEIKKQNSNIKRVYVRSYASYIDKTYKDYLLQLYDDTFMPAGIERAGKASYVERNQKMVELSDFCVFYYNTDYVPPSKRNNIAKNYQPNSGTQLAYEYAKRKKKTIINVYQSF
ncbi:MAG: DUF1273 family protein [Clostridia bacterium]|nr:DUF1273 family protein [Clostridia bacterium]